MPFLPITDTEIAANKPLKSDILARLRDNPQQVLCDPPGSTTLKVRPMQFCLAQQCDFNYKTTATPFLGWATRRDMLCNMSLQIAFNTSAAYLSDPMRSSTAVCGLWINPTVVYVNDIATAVRFKRRHPPVISSGAGSGTLQTQAFVDIPLTNTFVSIFTLTRSGQTPTIQVKAWEQSGVIMVQAQSIGTWTGRVWCGWTGYLFNMEYKAP